MTASFPSRGRTLTALIAMIVACMPALASAKNAYTTQTLNLTSHPSPAGQVLGVVPRGAEVDVVSCIAEAGWCHIHYRGAAGYAQTNWLSVEQKHTTLDYSLPSEQAIWYDHQGTFHAPAAVGAPVATATGHTKYTGGYVAQHAPQPHYAPQPIAPRQVHTIPVVRDPILNRTPPHQHVKVAPTVEDYAPYHEHVDLYNHWQEPHWNKYLRHAPAPQGPYDPYGGYTQGCVQC